jgi:undecaprenyl-diphosphatase
LEAHLYGLIAYLAAHSHIGWMTVLAAARLESVALVGVFFHGSTLVFVGGVLIGLGVLDPAWAAAGAVIGAILGDGFSYWLGSRFRGSIRTIGVFRRHARVLERGEAFFVRNGASSVFIGRFIGPLRSIVPLSWPACRACRRCAFTASTFSRRWPGRRRT